MGLDNGIIIKSNKEIKAPFWVKLDFFNNLDRTRAEVCYWRKCWGIRNLIIDELNNGDEDFFEYRLLVSDIHNIRKVLKYFNNRKRWTRFGHSIWDWDEIKWKLVYQQMNLYWLARYMEKNEVEVYFYDSY